MAFQGAVIHKYLKVGVKGFFQVVLCQIMDVAGELWATAVLRLTAEASSAHSTWHTYTLLLHSGLFCFPTTALKIGFWLILLFSDPPVSHLFEILVPQIPQTSWGSALWVSLLISFCPTSVYPCALLLNTWVLVLSGLVIQFPIFHLHFSSQILVDTFSATTLLFSLPLQVFYYYLQWSFWMSRGKRVSNSHI